MLQSPTGKMGAVDGPILSSAIAFKNEGALASTSQDEYTGISGHLIPPCIDSIHMIEKIKIQISFASSWLMAMESNPGEVRNHNLCNRRMVTEHSFQSKGIKKARPGGRARGF
jgi:hypothetical protein